MDPCENIRKQIKRYFFLPLFIAGLYSCDVLESDVEPQSPDIEINGNEIYMLPDGNGYIDLYSLVKSSADVRVDISGKPSNGNLSELATGLLQYSPAANFRRGRDSFEFSIYSKNNALLKRDTVVIIVDPDSTKFPCGIYSKPDFVEAPSGPVLINVLQNDIICADSSRVRVEIYRPSSSFPPYAGTAVVAGQQILYTPGASFTGQDKIIYRVFDILDSTKSALGVVVIAPRPNCTFSVYNDSYAFTLDSLTTDSLAIPVFQNDQLCGRSLSQYQFTLLHNGDVGIAYYRPERPDLLYTLPDSTNQPFTDSLVYRLCYQARCETAKVYIQIK